LAWKYKSTRTAQGHSGAGGFAIKFPIITIFASLGRGRRCGDQAFFDKWTSIQFLHRNRMTASSCMPSTGYEKAAALKSKPPHKEGIFTTGKNLRSSGFFFSAAGQMLLDITK